jgi:hypothetical protein
VKSLLTFLLTSAAAGALAADRPSILFIMSDDHAYQAISAHGDKRQLIQTPLLQGV